MYDRQERVFTFQETRGTDENVGPGSYCPESARCNFYEIGYAPFNSLDERKLDFSVKGTFPAPGDYNGELVPDKIKGCSSVGNKDSRFKPFKSLGPGPDAYTINSTWAGKKPGPCGVGVPDWLLQAVDTEVCGDGNQVGCDKINYVRFRDVPSIPSGNYKHGYEEGPDGRLRPQKGPAHDPSLGPAYYAPTKAPKFTRYGGCIWSKQTSQREPLYRSVHKIGPGAYDPYGDHWEKLIEIAHDRDFFQSQNPLNVPRYIDKVIHEEKKSQFPSPAAYKIPDTIRNVVRHNPSGGIIQMAPFNVAANRFRSDLNAVPGPNTYDVLNNWPELVGKTPFNTTAKRFKGKHERLPAPNSYAPLNTFIEDMIKKNKVNLFIEDKIPFGTTAKRFGPNAQSKRCATSKHAETTPGPGHYQNELFEKSKSMSKAPGLGTEKREDKHIRSVAPPPGTYNLASAYDATQSKRWPAPPQTFEGKERQGAFLSSTERFDKLSCLQPKDPSQPGPSDYCLPTSLNDKTGKLVFQSERFQLKNAEALPGPADYKPSSEVSDSVLKGTFNVRLNNPYATTECITDRSIVRVT